MHGLRHPSGVTRILALDLGKFNSVLCAYGPVTHVHHFASVRTTPQSIHDLLVAARHGRRVRRTPTHGRDPE